MKEPTLESYFSLDQKLKERLRNFVALSNNHVMSLSVSGDDILVSSKIIKEAQDLVQELDNLKRK